MRKTKQNIPRENREPTWGAQGKKFVMWRRDACLRRTDRFGCTEAKPEKGSVAWGWASEVGVTGGKEVRGNRSWARAVEDRSGVGGGRLATLGDWSVGGIRGGCRVTGGEGGRGNMDCCYVGR